MLIQNKGINHEIIRNRTVHRVNCNVYIQGSTQFYTNPNFDLSLVTVKAILKRNKEKITLFDGGLDVLAHESMHFHGVEALNDPTAAMQMNAYPANIGILLPLFVELGGPVTLQGDDEIYFEANQMAGWMGNVNNVPAECTIDYQWRDTIEVEQGTPQIHIYYLQPGQVKVDESLGNNVVSVALVCTNERRMYESTTPYRELNMISDRYQILDDYRRMISRRNSSFDSVQDSSARGQVFLYRPKTEIDDVRINMTNVGANVLQGKTAIVWRAYHIDPYTWNRAGLIDTKHAHRDRNKLAKHGVFPKPEAQAA